MKELELISIKSDIMFHDLINKDKKMIVMKILNLD